MERKKKKKDKILYSTLEIYLDASLVGGEQEVKTTWALHIVLRIINSFQCSKIIFKKC